MKLPKSNSASPKKDFPATREPAYLLACPPELRQSIFLYTYDENTPLHTNLFIDLFLERQDFIETHAKLLQSTHPSLSKDAEYVKEKWRKSYREKTDELKKILQSAWDNRNEPNPVEVKIKTPWGGANLLEDIDAFGLGLRTMR